MFELLQLAGIVLGCWFLGKYVLYRLFPDYALRVAEKRYRRRPDHINAKILWKARRRVKRRMNTQKVKDNL